MKFSSYSSWIFIAFISVISSWASIEKSKYPSSTCTRDYSHSGHLKKPRKGSSKLSRKNSLVKSSIKKQAAESQDRVYGIKSYSNDISMKELLKRCSPNHVEEKDYPDRSNMKKKGLLPPAKSTKASRMYVESIHPPPNEFDCKSPFKLRKFLRVESKVKSIFRQSSEVK